MAHEISVGFFHAGVEFHKFVDEQKQKLGSKFKDYFKFVIDDKNNIHEEKRQV